MSQLTDLIAQCDAESREANARSDRAALLKALEDYRRSVGRLNDCSDDIKKELGAWVRGVGRVSIDLLLISAAIHADLRFIDELCELLAMKSPEVPDEMIADILYKIPSPKAVPWLAEALFRKHDYDVYDECNVKCLEALYAIRTPDALDAVESAITSSSERVRERARELCAKW